MSRYKKLIFKLSGFVRNILSDCGNSTFILIKRRHLITLMFTTMGQTGKVELIRITNKAFKYWEEAI